MTGMGVVSCLGNEVEQFYNHLLEVNAYCSQKGCNICWMVDGLF